MLVVAFALAGRIDIDLNSEPLSFDPNGEPVYLKDIWPSSGEIAALVQKHVKQAFYAEEYGRIFEGDEFWKAMPVTRSTTFNWDPESTYIKNPPYFDGFDLDLEKPRDIGDARALLVLGDSVTTDHISPAGAIPETYPAGRYLLEKGVAAADFNSYGSRRGNHEVMMRGTFGNIRIKNKLVDPKEGSFTRKFPDAEDVYIYEAASAYQAEGVPLVVLGGKEYGTGSSRDWAAKGTTLLGIRAVIAESYERIHRSNLVGMGVLPLMFLNGDSWQQLGLDGSETYSLSGVESMQPRKHLVVKAVRDGGSEVNFEVRARLDTDVDVDYFENGGILPYVLRKVMKDS
jgi:aconitate hydratase